MFRNQLQLLGAVCLLVSWKVRAHSPITAQRLVEYTDYNVTVDNILVSTLDLLEYVRTKVASFSFFICIELKSLVKN